MPLQEFNNIVNLLYRTVSTDDSCTSSSTPGSSENGQTTKKVPRRLLRFMAILRPVLVDALGTDDDGKLYIFSSSNLLSTGIQPASCCTQFGGSDHGSSFNSNNHNNNNNISDSKEDCDKINPEEIKHKVINGTCEAHYKPYQVEVVLKTLNNLIHRMPVKEDGQIMEGRILLTIPFYLDFLEDFLADYTPQFISSLPRSLGSFQKDTIVTSVLSLLYHPVMFLDLKLVHIIDVDENDVPNGRDCQATNGSISDADKLKYNPPSQLQLFSSIDNSVQETAALCCAARIIELIARYEPCLYGLYDNYESSSYYVTNGCSMDNGEELESNAIPFALGIVGAVSLGLLLVPNEYFIPFVYSHEHELGKHVPFISTLLESIDQTIHEKGLLLLRNLISNIEPRSLSGVFYEEYISKGSNGSIDQFLLKIAVFSSEESIRNYARDLYRCLFHCFDADGMFTMLMSNLCSRSIVECPSAVTFLLYISRQLVTSSSFESNSGHKLRRLLQQVIKLSLNAGTETDLCENHDVILESLNLIRFFALKYQKGTVIVINKQSSNNSTNLQNGTTRSGRSELDCVEAFRSLVPEIKKKMLKPLRSALDLSRAHFTLELTKLQNESAKSARNRRMERIKEIKALDLKVLNELRTSCKSNPNTDQDLLSLPENHERDIISMSLVKFDLIESILTHVSDLFNTN